MATQEELARLAAGAQNGTAGVAAYDEALREIKATRQQAIAGLAAEVRAGGGDDQVLTELRGRVERPVGELLDALTAERAAHRGELQRMGEAQLAYQGQVAGALPVLRAEIERDEAAARREMLERLRASGGGGGGGGGSDPNELSDSRLRTYGLGMAELARQQRAQGLIDAGQAVRLRAAQRIQEVRARAGTPAALTPGQRLKQGQYRLWGARVGGWDAQARRAVRTAQPALQRLQRMNEQMSRAARWIMTANQARQSALPGAGQQLAYERSQRRLGAVRQVADESLSALRRLPRPMSAAEAADYDRTIRQARMEAAAIPVMQNVEAFVRYQDEMRARALERLASGVGLQRDAENALVQAGVDPARVFGLFDPSEMAGDVAARRRAMGLPETDEPELVDLPRVTLPVDEAARRLGVKPQDAQRWLAYQWQPLDAEGYPATDSQGNVKPPVNVYQSAVQFLQDRAAEGMDARTAARLLANEPYAGRYPRTVQLAIMAAEPLFQSRLGAQVTRDQIAGLYGG